MSYLTMPFKHTEKRAGALHDFDHLLGLEWDVQTLDSEGVLKNKRYKLVQYDSNAGSSFSTPQDKTFIWHVRSAYEVLPCSGNTDRVCGVSPCEASDLDADDYFFIQVDGEAYVIQGDDTANDVTVGEYVRPDNDADLGKCASNSTTFAEGITFARPITGASETDGARCLVDLMGPLKG